MGRFVELLSDCCVDLRMPVAVNVAPQTAHSVEVFPAIHIDERAAAGPLDNERLILGHLREGMPDMREVPAF